jgi:predicted phage-related endonuclease
MLEQPTQAINHIERRAFICGSDAHIIIGDDEAALFRLWRDKRG